MKNSIYIALLPCVALMLASSLFGGFVVNAQRNLKDTIMLNSNGKIVINQSAKMDKLMKCDTVLTLSELENRVVIDDGDGSVVKRAGFRIQVYSSGGSKVGGKAIANSRAATVKSELPEASTYVSYKAPYWRMRVGDFLTREDALVVMEQLKAVFPEFAKDMIVVRDRINYR